MPTNILCTIFFYIGLLYSHYISNIFISSLLLTYTRKLSLHNWYFFNTSPSTMFRSFAKLLSQTLRSPDLCTQVWIQSTERVRTYATVNLSPQSNNDASQRLVWTASADVRTSRSLFVEWDWSKTMETNKLRVTMNKGKDEVLRESGLLPQGRSEETCCTAVLI